MVPPLGRCCHQLWCWLSAVGRCVAYQCCIVSPVTTGSTGADAGNCTIINTSNSTFSVSGTDACTYHGANSDSSIDACLHLHQFWY